ncbi:Cys-tRNA(Pro) deacylase [Ethanoligenens harbinense]|uniref:Cys-tRNA(Pro)/Cys-tRNA(Cys) deacylase n=1 Tax=Ethanoligenens harbinense (strain DSM 18485 / JCM 12961 / CGMCC 1.5033 / YUAN-3) TaxID=663278 RepID=E6U6X0_ETHHY|nr:ybaK/ebsC protein [Ethanoligenens harbinense YUAN-3]
MKTNVMRMLDKAHISYETATYVYDEKDLSGVHAATQVTVITPEQCFKTLVARADQNNLFVFCIPVAKELDLKAGASASGQKRMELIHVKELPVLTGYLRGGCSPIGMKKNYPVFIDQTAMRFDRIGVSGGHRGVQVILAPDALAGFVQGQFAPLTRADGAQ